MVEANQSLSSENYSIFTVTKAVFEFELRNQLLLAVNQNPENKVLIDYFQNRVNELQKRISDIENFYKK